MKILLNPILLVILIIFTFPILISGQKTQVYELVGKNINKVINTYGKPYHLDKSNPSMECVFYKTKTNRMAFVGNENGIFQAEMCSTFTSSKKAKKSYNEIIQTSIKSGYEADTLSNENIKVTKNGIVADITFFENTFTKKYEVNVKARKN